MYTFRTKHVFLAESKDKRALLVMCYRAVTGENPSDDEEEQEEQDCVVYTYNG